MLLAGRQRLFRITRLFSIAFCSHAGLVGIVSAGSRKEAAVMKGQSYSRGLFSRSLVRVIYMYSGTHYYLSTDAQ
jgi:hypothetical protein